ncbi:hypothetical protein Amet_0883 [Alkaliphilus metalliredigens QYMF]|uniref:Uncharacterized protein n=1 Tax=Alkaliphilus metalliredigens (strain QYMF) TaxID=293826 RepID=A6TLN7_ALKMQ|nr:hypothetical protein Amet_0883 [Alkaliphilus metalliredigens QYMF]
MYKAHGITGYQLKTTEDLLKVHGIGFKAVQGYARLDDLLRILYEKLFLNFFNGLGFRVQGYFSSQGYLLC